MKLFTSVKIPDYPFTINHNSKIFTIGSCFSSNIGNMLYQRGFNIEVDPFGTLFNPLSIIKNLEWTTSPKEKIDDSRFVKSEGITKHLDFSSTFAASSQQKLSQLLEKTRSQQQINFTETNIVIVTFGTAFIYQTKKGAPVASCHKQPPENFTKTIISVNEIVDAWRFFVEQHPTKKFIFTISPVRHIKDGLIENQKSKSILHLAVQNIIASFNNCYYFPSYEITLDELRDYRFYKEDLIHPNHQAVKYLFEKYEDAFCPPETQKLSDQFYKIVLFYKHLPMHKDPTVFEKEKEDRIKKFLQQNTGIKATWIRDKYSKY